MSIYTMLSVLDMLAGFLMLIQKHFGIALLLLGILMLVKGAYSFFSAVSSGYWLDWMGAVDMVAGISLMLIYAGFSSAVLITIGGIVVAKGAYSLVRSALAAR